MASGLVEENPVCEAVAAVSVGKVGRAILLDLDYAEDSTAGVDCNVVMTAGGRFIEVQGTAESAPFDRQEMDRMMDLATRGIRRLFRLQEQALSRA